jgi:Ca-activated chloride channel family protein
MTSFNLFINNFHFIRPWWLLAILGLFFALWLIKRLRFNSSPWNKFLPSHLSHVLVEGTNNNIKETNHSFLSDKSKLIKPLLIGLLTIIALAGPAWEKLPQPVYQTERGSVLIMDMSYSMYATDIKPNRLTRTRYKAVDLLNKLNEGDIGLIAYAGDAFIISPLTQDIKNIELLLPSLSPEIMPEPGANPFAALSLAHDMLTNAGYINGDIYWFTDDVDNSEITDIYDWSSTYGHQLNILGIGTNDGAPITLPSGELLKDNYGAIVVPKVPIQKLNALARRGNGVYQTITNNDSDIEKLILNTTVLDQSNKNEKQNQQNGDQWQEQGPWLLVIVLPLLLSYFRRGATMLMLSFMTLPLISLFSLTLLSSPAIAEEVIEAQAIENTNTTTSAIQQAWQNLWQTNDQQAQQQFNQENYQGAAEQFDNSQWQGSSHYKAGNFQEALDAFKKGEQSNSADSLYNQGNALAQLQQYEQAIEHYEQALAKNPELQDAKDNIEKIKQQQQKEEQQQEQQQGDDSNESNDQENNEQNADQQQSQDQQNKQKSDNGEQQDQESNEQSQQSDQQGDASEENANKDQEGENKDNQQQEQSEESKQEQQSAEQAEESTEEGQEKTAAQIAAEQKAKETEQKHQQLLNKVTDDPHLLLRNKMQLEYQKRQQNGASQGVKKKW